MRKPCHSYPFLWLRNGEQKSNGVVRTTSESWFSRSPDFCLPPRCSARRKELQISAVLATGSVCWMKAAYHLQWYTHFEKIYSNPSIKSQLRKLLAKEDVQKMYRRQNGDWANHKIDKPRCVKDVITEQAKSSARVDSRQIQADW